MNRIDWFKNARFGMFIHFGLYSLYGKGEWVRSIEHIDEKDYLPYFDMFDPDIDFKYIAKMAKNAGMKYMVLTTKHHEGFCLFDSKYTDFKVTNTKVKKDLVKEFVEACREEGLKVGLYYSLLDWHHPDYPSYNDRHHPLRGILKDDGKNFDNYLDFMHHQVEELCTNSGKIDIMWFDFSYDDMVLEKWKATELVTMVRKLQPGIILNSRLAVSGENHNKLTFNNDDHFYADFTCPEQIIPPFGLQDENGNDVNWEACVTMNDNWGYYEGDENYKLSSQIIKKLIECVSKNGNMILNIGPDGNGKVPKQQIKILEEIGQWMKVNHESIYHCGRSYLPKPENGRITQNGNILYYHIYESALTDVPLYGIEKDRVAHIYRLMDNKELKVEDNWIVNNYPDITFVKVSDKAYLPDELDTIVNIVYKD